MFPSSSPAGASFIDMKYINIAAPGGPEVLRVAEGETPVAGNDQVLIKVHAAGVNRADTLQRQGKYPPPAGASEVPGLEIAGEVSAVGAGVAWPKTGDRVCALVPGGGYGEFAVAHAGSCLPVPDSLTLEQAAGIPETYFTVWSNVFDRAGLREGETLLVHGGASGIGTTAIQLARAFGARVFVTAGSEEKCAACRALGAELAINYRNEDFVKACKTATGDRGVNVILDMIAGDYMTRNIDVAAVEGRIVIIAGMHGYKAEVNFLPVMLKRLIITGSGLRGRSDDFKAAIAAALKEKVWPLLEAGVVRPLIYKVVPAEQAAEAHRIMEAGEHTGKIILSWH